MFCKNCGADLEATAKVCPSCGTATGQSEAAQPMGWFKFLIYFALFAGAVLNAINGIQILTGAVYEGAADAVYAMFADLKTLDMLMGVCLLALAAFGVYTRFRLSGFRKNGPKMLSILYVAVAAINLIYMFGQMMVLPSYVTESVDFTSVIANTAVNIAMLFVNRTYFGKRADLFVND